MRRSLQSPARRAQKVIDSLGPALGPDSMLAQAFQDLFKVLSMVYLHQLQNTAVDAAPR